MNVTRTSCAAALLTAAGIAVTVVPAAADAPDPAHWTVTDHQDQPARAWTVADHSHTTNRTASRPVAPSRTEARHRIAGHHARHHRAARASWTASSSCHPAQASAGADRVWRVGPGDTLWLIASCHPGVTVDQIRARNGVRGDLIRDDQLLFIPAAKS